MSSSLFTSHLEATTWKAHRLLWEVQAKTRLWDSDLSLPFLDSLPWAPVQLAASQQTIPESLSGPAPFLYITPHSYHMETTQDSPLNIFLFPLVGLCPPPHPLKWLKCSVGLRAKLFLPQCLGISGHKLSAD